MHLTRLDISGNLLRALPALFSHNLSILRLGRNQLLTVPSTLSRATALQELELQHNFITELPSSFEFRRLGKLVLAYNQLRTLPLAVFDCRQLTHFDLSKNYITNVSEAISQLTNLRYLNASSNLLKGLPAGIGQLTLLSELVLDHNRLTSLHSNIGKLELLAKMPLFNNCLEELPDEFCKLTRLDEINLAFNRLRTLPANFGQLTHLERVRMTISKAIIAHNNNALDILGWQSTWRTTRVPVSFESFARHLNECQSIARQKFPSELLDCIRNYWGVARVRQRIYSVATRDVTINTIA